MGFLHTGAGASILLTAAIASVFSIGASQEANGDPLLHFPLLPTIEDNLVEVYNGEHFTDLAVDETEMFRLATLLVLYEASCKEKALSLGMFDTQALPPVTYLNYMSHDYVGWKEKSWFQFSEKQDLAALYGVSSCPTALYWEKGWSRNALPIRWTQKQEVPFRKWIVSQLMTSVTLVNERNHDAEFLLPNSNETVLVEAKSQISIDVHEPWKGPVSVRHPMSTDTLKAWAIVSSREQLVLKEEGSFSYYKWEEAVKKNQREFYEFIKDFRTNCKERHELVQDHPPRHKSLTKHGFTIGRMPTSLHESLRSAWAQNTTEHRRLRTFAGSPFNDDEASTLFLRPPKNESRALASQLKPLAEDWCQCQLDDDVILGFRQYNKGCRIRLHVDVSSSGRMMIGSILPIDQDMQGAPDWQFQAIGLDDGVSHRFSSIPGDMILFEPSLVPHGRPDIMQGGSVLNAFVFYYVESREARGSGREEL